MPSPLTHSLAHALPTAAIGTEALPIPSELHVPPPNVLIATDFSLLPAPEGSEPSAPTLVDQQLTHAVWHQPDATFRMPRCNVYVNQNALVVCIPEFAAVVLTGCSKHWFA